MTNLTQPDADALIMMKKYPASGKPLRPINGVVKYPLLKSGDKISIPLISEDGKEQFFLDLKRGKIGISRRTYQNRGRKEVPLIRLDFGVKHRNPDNTEIGSPHLHIYREGYGDKFAQDVPKKHFSNLDNYKKTLKDFIRYCNIANTLQFNSPPR